MGLAMNIDHLRTFLEVALTGSFHRTAEHLNVTQSTISARIKALEDRLDRRLFTRSKNGVELTGAGRRLRRHADTAVRAWEQGRQMVGLPEELSAVFSIGVQSNLAEWLASTWIPFMRQECPTVGINFEADFSEGLMRRIEDGLLDMAVIYAPTTRPGITMEPLWEEDIVLVSTIPRKVEAGWRDDYVFADGSPQFRTDHSEAFPEMDTAAIRIGMPNIALYHILENGGSAYLFQSSVEQYVESGELHRVEGAPVFSQATYLVHPNEPINPTTHAAAVEGIRRAVGIV